jgi:GalNAc-alpha-(1->4)-GalNAc-alpha-(1->3)-diNAcBac-PP-undecaprenol alpha-1,4-N-acetyl-D-galactosaminyltransferase
MLTTQTEAAAARVSDIYPGLRRVYSIPNPLADDVAAYRKKTGHGRKILLSLGRLAAEKQIEKLLNAFGSVASKFQDWDLHIFGDGPLRSSLERQIEELELQGRAFLMGRTDNPWKIMSGADAFAMTSRYEGFPNALLEAMGVGLPCIVFDCPSGPREISRNGKDAVLIPLDDQAGLVAALAKLMGDEELRNSLGDQARDSVLSRFSLAAAIGNWDRLFMLKEARKIS